MSAPSSSPASAGPLLPLRLSAYVINLASAGDRWAAIQKTFGERRIDLVQVPAVDGTALSLPVAGYSERLYQRLHGRTTNLREVGCYLSHLRACETFLESSESHALIFEDDVTPGAEFDEVVSEVMQHGARWDIVRLSGLGTGCAVRAMPLHGAYSLCVNFGRLKGAGAYLVNRRAARSMVQTLLPMKLPFDHAIDREWCYGLRALSVLPFPVSQTGSGFRTSIQRGLMQKLSRLRRWQTTYPYQAWNEVSRWLFRGLSLVGLGLWSAKVRPA